LKGSLITFTQRGNGRQVVFHDESDYRLYRDLLRGYAARYSLDLWAYCLMPNHVHLIAVPRSPAAMARTLARTHSDYARHFNIERRTCGHVWQARFYSCPLGDSHLVQAMAYVESNPVRAGLVKEAWRYPRSSAAAHAGGEELAGFLSPGPWQTEYTAERWREVLETSVAEEALCERLRAATLRGRPVGTEDFLNELERKAR
jgi:putative transposase